MFRYAQTCFATLHYKWQMCSSVCVTFIETELIPFKGWNKMIQIQRASWISGIIGLVLFWQEGDMKDKIQLWRKEGRTDGRMDGWTRHGTCTDMAMFGAHLYWRMLDMKDSKVLDSLWLCKHIRNQVMEVLFVPHTHFNTQPVMAKLPLVPFSEKKREKKRKRTERKWLAFPIGNDFPELGKVMEMHEDSGSCCFNLTYLSGVLACRVYTHGRAMNSDEIRFLLVLDSSARPGLSP